MMFDNYWKTRIRVVSVAAAVVLSACAHTVSNKTIQSAAARSEVDTTGSVTYQVASSENFLPLVGVQVSVIYADGTAKDLGDTGYGGSLVVEKSQLQRATVVLFCKDYYFCGAFVAEQTDILRWNERLIHLAPFYIP
jgi:hypothetical protein